MNVTRITKTAKIPKGKTDWEKLEKMTEAEILAAAKSDIDNPPLSKKQLAKFRRVQPPAEVNVKQIRNNLNISQGEFAAFFGVSLRTLQEWEQGRRMPKGPARALLLVIAFRPDAVQEALRLTANSAN